MYLCPNMIVQNYLDTPETMKILKGSPNAVRIYLGKYGYLMGIIPLRPPYFPSKILQNRPIVDVIAYFTDHEYPSNNVLHHLLTYLDSSSSHSGTTGIVVPVTTPESVLTFCRTNEVVILDKISTTSVAFKIYYILFFNDNIDESIQFPFCPFNEKQNIVVLRFVVHCL